MKAIKISLAIITFFLCTSFCFATTSEKATFVRCVDGDTAILSIKNNEEKFRFLAIDTPETVHPTKEVEKYGKDASEYTCNMLTNAKEIIVEYESSKKDKYERTLAWIWVDKKLLQEELIKIGYAKVAYIYGNYRYTESLCVVENEAFKNKIGLWENEKNMGYCDTVDLKGKTNTISYNNLYQNSTFDIVIDHFLNSDEFEDNYLVILFIIMILSVITKLLKKTPIRKIKK